MKLLLRRWVIYFFSCKIPYSKFAAFLKIAVKIYVKVAQLCLTLCDPMDCIVLNSPGQNTRVGSLSLLQGIFPIQESNQGLLPCRQILYQLNYQGVFRTIYSKKPPWMFLCLLSYEFLLSSMTNSPITQRVLYRLLLSTNCFQILIFQI